MYVLQAFLFLNLFCLDLFIILFYEQINLFLYTVVNTGSCILKRKKKPLQKENKSIIFTLKLSQPDIWLHGRGGTGWDPGTSQGLGIAEMWAE